MDSLGGNSAGPRLFPSAVTIGLLLGVLPGLLIVFAQRGKRWVPVYESMDAERRAAALSLESRWAESRPPQASRDTWETFLAWVLLLLFILGVRQFFRWYLTQ